jgi:hypothetical protein
MRSLTHMRGKRRQKVEHSIRSIGAMRSCRGHRPVSTRCASMKVQVARIILAVGAKARLEGSLDRDGAREREQRLERLANKLPPRRTAP